MSRAVAVLRPEPGNARTAARVEAAGLLAIRLPLFTVRPLDWTPPDPAAFDALLLTSANAIRHGGTALAALRSLPVLAVGQNTAVAATGAGFAVIQTGAGGVDALLAERRGRLLHLAGRARMPDRPGVVAIPVYAADALPIDAAQAAGLRGSVALLHSARAARAFAALIDSAGLSRSTIRIAAISPAVAAAAGDGWAVREAAGMPDDGTLVALACALAD